MSLSRRGSTKRNGNNDKHGNGFKIPRISLTSLWSNDSTATSRLSTTSAPDPPIPTTPTTPELPDNPGFDTTPKAPRAAQLPPIESPNSRPSPLRRGSKSAMDITRHHDHLPHRPARPESMTIVMNMDSPETDETMDTAEIYNVTTPKQGGGSRPVSMSKERVSPRTALFQPDGGEYVTHTGQPGMSHTTAVPDYGDVALDDSPTIPDPSRKLRDSHSYIPPPMEQQSSGSARELSMTMQRALCVRRVEPRDMSEKARGKLPMRVKEECEESDPEGTARESDRDEMIQELGAELIEGMTIANAFTSPSYFGRTPSILTASSSSSSGGRSGTYLPLIPGRSTSRPKNSLPPPRASSRANLPKLPRPPPRPNTRGSSLAVTKAGATSISSISSTSTSCIPDGVSGHDRTTYPSARRTSNRPSGLLPSPVQPSDSVFQLLDELERLASQARPKSESRPFSLPIPLHRTRSQPELIRRLDPSDSMAIPFKFRIKRSPSSRVPTETAAKHDGQKSPLGSQSFGARLRLSSASARLNKLSMKMKGEKARPGLDSLPDSWLLNHHNGSTAAHTHVQHVALPPLRFRSSSTLGITAIGDTNVHPLSGYSSTSLNVLELPPRMSVSTARLSMTTIRDDESVQIEEPPTQKTPTPAQPARNTPRAYPNIDARGVDLDKPSVRDDKWDRESQLSIPPHAPIAEKFMNRTTSRAPSMTSSRSVAAPRTSISTVRAGGDSTAVADSQPIVPLVPPTQHEVALNDRATFTRSISEVPVEAHTDAWAAEVEAQLKDTVVAVREAESWPWPIPPARSPITGELTTTSGMSTAMSDSTLGGPVTPPVGQGPHPSGSTQRSENSAITPQKAKTLPALAPSPWTEKEHNPDYWGFIFVRGAFKLLDDRERAAYIVARDQAIDEYGSEMRFINHAFKSEYASFGWDIEEYFRLKTLAMAKLKDRARTWKTGIERQRARVASAEIAKAIVESQEMGTTPPGTTCPSPKSAVLPSKDVIHQAYYDSRTESQKVWDLGPAAGSILTIPLVPGATGATEGAAPPTGRRAMTSGETLTPYDGPPEPSRRSDEGGGGQWITSDVDGQGAFCKGPAG